MRRLSGRFVVRSVLALLPLVATFATVLDTAADSLPAVLDPTFGTSLQAPGRVTFDLRDGMVGYVSSVLPLPDGRMLVGGMLYNASGGMGFWAGRLFSDGSLDPSFGSNGITQVRTFSGLGFGYAGYTPTMTLVD